MQGQGADQGGNPQPPATAVQTTTAGPPSTSDSSPASLSSSATSAAPVAAPPPPQCPGGSCQELITVSLGDGFVAVLRSGQSAGGAGGAVVLELTQTGVPVDWHAVDGQTPAHISCIGGAAANCVVTAYVGAHGATATVWRLGESGARLTQVASADADTPSMAARDLNGDGFLDVLGLQNDYTPDYATGQVQWQTWLFDGKNLSSTGCTALAAAPPPRPSVPVTGTCAAH